MASSYRRNEQASLPCPVWAYSTQSNVHIAKDRCWFGDDYKPFSSFVEGANAGSIEVIGIGSVDLPTKTSPAESGPSSHGVLHLKNVLHVPDVVCNLIGAPINDDYGLLLYISEDPTGDSGQIADNSDGRSVAYFKPRIGDVRFFEVQLSAPPVGPKVGPSPFNPSVKYWLTTFWPDSERGKLATSQAQRPLQLPPGPLTRAEKDWAKHHFGSFNELKFLQAHGLSIYDEEDREEGRAILRALMSQENHNGQKRTQGRRSRGRRMRGRGRRGRGARGNSRAAAQRRP